MKKVIVTLTATLVCAGAFGQGKLSFDINTDNLIYITTDTSKMLAADVTKTADNGLGAGPVALPGSSLYSGAGSTAAALGGTWVVSLFGGTSSGSLSLQTTAALADISSYNFGGINAVQLTFANLPAGTPAWFQVQVSNGGTYNGQSAIFQATPQANVYAPIWETAPPVASTWAPGTQEMSDFVANIGTGSGYVGGIAVSTPYYWWQITYLGFDNSDSGALLIYFTTNTWKLAPADRTATADNGGGAGPFPIAGSGLYTGPGSTVAALSGSPTIIAALYGGGSPNSLSLQATTTIQGAAGEGLVVPVGVTEYSFQEYFQVQVFDSRANANAPVINGVGGGAADAWAHTNLYAGVSQIFGTVPGYLFGLPVSEPIWDTSHISSTWAHGTFPVVDMTAAYGPGHYGAIEVYANAWPPPPQPQIISQPTSATNYSGQGIIFTVDVQGNSPFSYQWQLNGTNLSDGGHISGSATNTLTLSAITLADAGNYTVIITNSYGSITSSVAALTVLAAPNITVQPQSQTNAAGSNVVFSVGVAAYPPVTYQWAFNGTNIAGATGASLLLTNVQFSQSGNYSLAVTNSLGYMISTSATLTVLSPPLLLSQPVSQIGYWGLNASFGVDVAGTLPFSYQWYFYDFPISWGTNATLDLQDLDLDAGGQYWVEVTNPYGSATSEAANLIVNPAGVSPGFYFGLTITGAVGKHFGIQYGTSVGGTTNWTALTNITLTQPVQLWVDSNVDVRTTPTRFYRVVAIP